MPPVSFKAHHEKLRKAKKKAAKNNQILTHSQTRYATSTVTTATGSTSSTIPLPLPPQTLRLLPPQIRTSKTTEQEVEDDGDNVKDIHESDHQTPKIGTQTSETLQAFLTNVPKLLDLMFECSVDNGIGNQCGCGVEGAQKTTRCYDCTRYQSSCSDCFIRAHRHLPFHWAEVWDFSQGFFVRHDIATLKPDIASINLGHSGIPCPSTHARNLIFTAVDINGIHKTKIRFCACDGQSRLEQLMRARLFPATISQPTTAFTFQVLHQSHIHHLESKESAYDCVAALRRLTDNAFPHHTPDVAPQFRMVMRVWRFLKASKRLGEALDIQKVLPHRREFIVHCPVCPDPRINMEDGWQNTPVDLCHLNQTQFTADGNHHSNRYLKNTDPDDISLYDGKSYFPKDSEYKKYIKKISHDAPEKSGPCDHLNALNSQDRKKFKNMDITGVVAVNCSHIFIKSMVDLQLGEKFANTDYALSHAISNTKPRDRELLTKLDDDFVHKCDHRQSYDISCGFCINAETRFENHFPDEADFVRNMKWLIPLLHVQNHIDNCMYLYSSAYQQNVGRFQGETVEHPWIALNHLANQTRQMNNGNRQEAISDHNSHWNWAKTSNMAATLTRDIQNAKMLFIQKHAAFTALCLLYANKLEEWNALDRTKRVKKNKEVECVYRQSLNKVPSRERIFQAIMDELNATGNGQEKTKIASFLNEGISLAEEQRVLQEQARSVNKSTSKTEVTKTKAKLDKALVADLESKRRRLENRIAKWRKVQKVLTPQLGDLMAQDAISGKAADRPENQTLFMPSDLSESQRTRYGVEVLAQYEYRLQEGLACDAIQKLRTTIKLRGALIVDKVTQARGQKQNTKSKTQIDDVDCLRDKYIADYSTARSAMIRLGGLSKDSATYPTLTVKDTTRKATTVKRGLGDSRLTDGALWTNLMKTSNRPRTEGSILLSQRHSSLPMAVDSPEDSTSTPLQPFGTQSVTTKDLKPGNLRGARGKKRRIEELSVSDDNGDSDTTDSAEGWIWTFRPRAEMSDKDVENWMSEGDRVQWFRAEAEMQRWQEEWEIKKVEFLRCIRSFGKISATWEALSKLHDPVSNSGRVSYARRTAAMYRQMERDAITLLEGAGYGELLSLKTNEDIVSHILAERLKYSIPGLDSGEKLD